jgi:hypothetical protein
MLSKYVLALNIYNFTNLNQGGHMTKRDQVLPTAKRRAADVAAIEIIGGVRQRPVSKSYQFQLQDVTTEARATDAGDRLIFNEVDPGRVAAVHSGRILGYAPVPYARRIIRARGEGRHTFATVLQVDVTAEKYSVLVRATEQ